MVSLLIHNELNEEINELEQAKAYYTQRLSKTKIALKQMNTDMYYIEKYAREKLLMKKENEEVFIIEED